MKAVSSSPGGKHYPVAGSIENDRCPACHGAGSCNPVQVKGRQGLWEWTP